MVGSSRRRTLRRQMQQGDAGGGGDRRRRPRRRRRRVPYEPRIDIVGRLPPELLAEVHSHLHAVDFLKRLAFASVCGASGRLFREETPCLLLGGTEDGRATVLSIADRRAATVRASDPAMRGRGHVVVGSSGGWLVTADARGALRMANPVTGAQADLPDITTSSFPFLTGAGGNDNNRFCLDVDALLRIRFGGPPPPPPPAENGGDWGAMTPNTFTFAAWQMGQFCYRKVVLSAAARPGRYAAMLILPQIFGAPAFATAEDPAWRLAPSPDGVEDAIHHRGQFYSITYSGAVEAWARDAGTGEFTSAAHAPKLAAGAEDDDGGGGKVLRRYLAAAPDERLMAVLKQSKDVEHPRWPDRVTTRVVFKVVVLDEARRRWEEAADIGGAALFVGVNATLCVSAAEHRGIRPNCVYFADDEVRCRRREGDEDSYYQYRYRDDNEEPRNVGVYSMKHGKVEKFAALGKQEQPRWPPPAWFTPSFL